MEAVRVRITVTTHTKKATITATGTRAAIVPAAVATPFPPLNLVYTGHTCPEMAASPYARAQAPVRPSHSGKSHTGTNPFSRSTTSTPAAGKNPRTR